MLKIICTIICCHAVEAIIYYIYAKRVKRNYPEININPDLYIIGGLLFGFFSLFWCLNKKRKFLK